ncbi:MAG TPA: hypothetical protein VE077_06610 [Candidatus Methylomirabilis sp.]|nr:hypothetical protein [Candidatus Methylomirabilis sp.]
MPVQKTEPPWEFLLSASKNSLQSYELSRLSHAANLRKEIGQLLDSWLEENSAAMLARWLMEQRERPLRAQDAPQASETRPGNVPHRAHSVSDNFLADQAVPPPVTRGAP